MLSFILPPPHSPLLMFIVSTQEAIGLPRSMALTDGNAPQCLSLLAPPLPRSVLRLQAHAVEETRSLAIVGMQSKSRGEPTTNQVDLSSLARSRHTEWQVVPFRNFHQLLPLAPAHCVSSLPLCLSHTCQLAVEPLTHIPCCELL